MNTDGNAIRNKSERKWKKLKKRELRKRVKLETKKNDTLGTEMKNTHFFIQYRLHNYKIFRIALQERHGASMMEV